MTDDIKNKINATFDSFGSEMAFVLNKHQSKEDRFEMMSNLFVDYQIKLETLFNEVDNHNIEVNSQVEVQEIPDFELEVMVNRIKSLTLIVNEQLKLKGKKLSFTDNSNDQYLKEYQQVS